MHSLKTSDNQNGIFDGMGGWAQNERRERKRGGTTTDITTTKNDRATPASSNEENTLQNIIRSCAAHQGSCSD